MAKKKRYYQSVRDRMNEGEGMVRYEMKKKNGSRKVDRSSNDLVTDRDPRRMREYRDGGDMIREDHSAPANLPQQPKIKYYPYVYDFQSGFIDDEVSGVDYQIDGDIRKANKYRSKYKY